MSFRTGMLAMVDAIRSIAGPAGLDIRTHKVTVRHRSWGGQYLGQGIPEDSDLVLNQFYKVRQITTQEIASSGGQFEMGDVLVDHITPSDGTIGYSPTQLAPVASDDNEEIIYVLDGPEPLAGEYSLRELRRWRPFTYQLVLRRRNTTP